MTCGPSSSAQRVLLIVLVLNVSVAALKGGYAAWSGSLAVASDAVHSLTDGLSNVVGLVALRMSIRRPDDRHPYGYHKVEILAALAIGVIIALSAGQLGLGALHRLRLGAEPPVVTLEGILLLLLTLLANVGVATYERRRGRALGSAFLLADAAHTQSDVFVTVGVIFSQVAAWWGLAWADPVAAIVVLAAVLWVAWRILGANVGFLLDRAIIDPEEVAGVVAAVPGARGCHRVRSRGTEGAVLLDLHLTLDGALPLATAHAIAHDAERALRDRFGQLIDVTIHVEPLEDHVDAV